MDSLFQWLKLRRSPVLVFCLIFTAAALWAGYTEHAWEDYYITFRAARNLATGHGLVFTEGERLHTFTSPLGVLMPAFASLLVGNNSDTGALWLFRLFSITALAGGGVLLWQAVRATATGRWSTAILAGLLATEVKTLDFSINGMETGFLMLFLGWTVWALFARPQPEWRHLGLAWAGLMWTRPDSWIYIGALGLGVVVFAPGGAGWRGRWMRVRTMLAAGGLTTVCYLPWLLWAWWYYGTPIPHTVTAKGLFGTYSVVRMWTDLIGFPGRIVAGQTPVSATFLPPYAMSTGWPAWLAGLSTMLAVAGIVLWLLPWTRREARVASFAAFVGQFYLYHIVGFPVPWYIPTVAVLSLIALVLAFDQALGWCARARMAPCRRLLLAATCAWIAGCAALSIATARQLRFQQQLIEDGHRRVIGEWLKANAAGPQESVFLEPLGYIGYFSGLKMLDFPGLSSREMITARLQAEGRSYPDCWSELIRSLLPDWLVLRPYEAGVIKAQDYDLLGREYHLARRFDVRDRVRRIGFLPGRAYLLNDGVFEVYARNHRVVMSGGAPGRTIALTEKELVRKGTATNAGFEPEQIVAHAPSQLVFALPTGTRRVAGRYGIDPRAYATPGAATDGAGFFVDLLAPDGRRRRLLGREIDPLNHAEDRDAQEFSFVIPSGGWIEIEFVITPGPADSDAFDWTYWSGLRCELSPSVPEGQ